jgi:hypothetical protein
LVAIFAFYIIFKARFYLGSNIVLPVKNHVLLKHAYFGKNYHRRYIFLGQNIIENYQLQQKEKILTM